MLKDPEDSPKSPEDSRTCKCIKKMQVRRTARGLEDFDQDRRTFNANLRYTRKKLTKKFRNVKTPIKS